MHFSFVTKFTNLSQSDHPLLPQRRGGPHGVQHFLPKKLAIFYHIHEVPLDAVGEGMIRLAQNRKFGYKTKMHWLLSAQKGLSSVRK